MRSSSGLTSKRAGYFMRLAIKEARRNFSGFDGGPFGACIVKGGEVISVARNTVLISDATAHAEINAIRLASKKLKNWDLSGCVIYSTTEPCPMCFAAIHWARISAVVYGTNISDAAGIGFNELAIACRRMKRVGKSPVRIHAGFLRRECLVLMEGWGRLENTPVY